jgi:hypothetical protein
MKKILFHYESQLKATSYISDTYDSKFMKSCYVALVLKFRHYTCSYLGPPAKVNEIVIDRNRVLFSQKKTELYLIYNTH